MEEIAVTRFNNKTWEENCIYRDRNDMKGCCYGTPVLLQVDIPIGALLYILEMNNDKNQIMGIGLIRNHNRADKRYCIYSDGNYNRYNYRSDYRIDRAEFKKSNNALLEVFELLVFKGYTHLKRGQGIQLVKKKKYKEIENKYSKEKILSMVKDLFINKYTN
tara:strand:- start:3672 stop:4157 length:486 start_codon:yes stop_codon:yes gene_type:complete